MEEIREDRVRRRALLPKSKPTLFLYEDLLRKVK